MPVILATQETEIRRITVQGQPGEKGSQDPISKKTSTKKKGAGGVCQGIGLSLQEKKKKAIFISLGLLIKCRKVFY
jgi:hypothetical protein